MASVTDLTSSEDTDLRLRWSGRWTLAHRILALNILTLLLVALSTLYLDVFRNRLSKERTQQIRLETTTAAAAMAHVPQSEWPALLAAASKVTGVPEASLELRAGHIVQAGTGEALMNLAKLLRSLHFSDKAELVMTTHYYEPPSQHQDKAFKGDVSAAYAWATQVAEVEVDTETGIVRLLRITGAHDVGRVLNRLGIEGQIEGGIVMGQGYALSEELRVEGGRILNPNFRDYKLVTAPEIPVMDIAFIESMDGEGPQGAKGVGEAPAICMAAAIANAIENATGVRITSLPFTPERVYRALHGSLPGVEPVPETVAT